MAQIHHFTLELLRFYQFHISTFIFFISHLNFYFRPISGMANQYLFLFNLWPDSVPMRVFEDSGWRVKKKNNHDVAKS